MTGLKHITVGAALDQIYGPREEESQATSAEIPLQILTAKEAEERKDKIETIRIGDGRHVLIVHHKDGTRGNDWQSMERLRRGLKRWWDSGDKFVILQAGSGTSFQFERVSDE